MIKDLSKIKNSKLKLTLESFIDKFCILCSMIVNPDAIFTRKFVIVVEIKDSTDDGDIGCVIGVYENHMIKLLATESVATNGREKDFLSINSERLTRCIIDMIETDVFCNKDINKFL